MWQRGCGKVNQAVLMASPVTRVAEDERRARYYQGRCSVYWYRRRRDRGRSRALAAGREQAAVPPFLSGFNPNDRTRDHIERMLEIYPVLARIGEVFTRTTPHRDDLARPTPNKKR